VVLNILDRHTKGTLYKAFEPIWATDVVQRIEFYCTPKRGGWPNIVEKELIAMSRHLRGPPGWRSGGVAGRDSQLGRRTSTTRKRGATGA